VAVDFINPLCVPVGTNKVHDASHVSTTASSCRTHPQVTHYQSDEVVVILAADHPLAGAGAIDVDQLYSLHFVSLHRSSTLQGIRSLLEAADICWTGLKVVMVRFFLLTGIPALACLPCSMQLLPSSEVRSVGSWWYGEEAVQQPGILWCSFSHRSL